MIVHARYLENGQAIDFVKNAKGKEALRTDKDGNYF